MSLSKTPGNVSIVYFSGTGCTRLAAEQLAAALTRHGAAVRLNELRAGVSNDVAEPSDLLVLVYPVYAMSAPGPVYACVKSLADTAGAPAAVISVSGGGETTPNRACRVRVIRLLKKKGFNVFYENMLVMPSNAITPTPPEAAVSLIRALPGKTGRIADDLLKLTVRRTKPGLLDRFMAFLGEFEKVGAKLIGHYIKIGAACTGCGVCAVNCPSGNITLRDGKPVFGKKCVTCLHCYYNCPQKALSPRCGKFLVLKQGFDLQALIRAAEAGGEQCVLPSGALWSGLKSYLEDKD